MSKGLMIFLGVVAVFVLAGLFVYGSFVSTQHQLVAKDEAVKTAWSNVDADLQRVSAIGYSAWLDQQMAMPPPPRWTSTRPRWAAGWARLLRTCRRSSRI